MVLSVKKIGSEKVRPRFPMVEIGGKFVFRGRKTQIRSVPSKGDASYLIAGFVMYYFEMSLTCVRKISKKNEKPLAVTLLGRDKLT